MATTTKTHRRAATQNRLTAMQHPLRGELLRLLLDRGPASPVQLARIVSEDTSNVAHHMKRLAELDCAELVETRQVRGATEHIYRATERSLVSLEEWEELGPAEKHWFVAEIFQQIVDDFVASEKAQVVGADKDLHLTRTPLMVDAQGLQEGMEIFEAARMAMAEVAARSAERSAASGQDQSFPISSSLALFRMPRSA
jgi:hypothetical protein